jgi:RNA polymerase sigma factor (sigma-70 family)
LRRQLPGASDDELIGRVRSGDDAAFGELYRRYRKAAEATARWSLRSRSDVDDVVADAFAGVLSAIRNGNGPRDNFRTYLLAAVRNGCRQRWQQADRTPSAGIEPGSTVEHPERYVEADTVARAFARLTPRWQQTLWLAEVEQRTPGEIAERLRLAPNAAAALTHRAREAFATAYLAEHVDTASGAACERFAPRLAGYVRGQLTDAQREQVDAHLADCDRCQRAVDELSDLNASLRTLGPVAGAAGLTAPVTIGTSLGMASSGLFGSGLLLKGAAAILVVAPLLVVELGGGRGGQGSVEERDPVAVVAGPAAWDGGDRSSDDAPTPDVVPVSDDAREEALARTTSTVLPESATEREPDAVATPVAPREPESPPSRVPALDQVVGSVVGTVVGGVVHSVVDGVEESPLTGPAVDAVLDVVAPVVEPVINLVERATPVNVQVAVGGTTPSGAASLVDADIDSGLADLGVAVAGEGIAADVATSPISTPLITIPSAAVDVGVTGDGVAVDVSMPAVSTPLVTLPAVDAGVGVSGDAVDVDVSLPPISTPLVALPGVDLDVSLSTATVPVTVGAVSVPEVTLPAVTVPAATVPAVAVPEVTLPAVAVPEVTVPEVTVPEVTVPEVTVPEVTVPEATLLDVTVPEITLPEILPP